MYTCQITPILASSGGLHPFDLVVIFLYMAGILLAGWYFSRGQKETQQFFVGGRSMPWMAVGLSIIATMLSTLTYLAAPGELIQHGPALALGWLSIPITFVIVNWLWIPFFMKLKVTSVYEYLEPRFGLATRWVAVALFVFILRLLWMAMIVLTASIAVAQITHPIVQQSLPWHPGMDQWTVTVLLSVGLLATVYTMFGGIKAVIWTDVAQFVALLAGILFTLIFVAVKTDTGPVQWWLNLVDNSASGKGFPAWFSFDPTERNVIFFTVLSTTFWYTCTFVADQVAVQRYLTTSSVKAARRGNIVNFVGDFIVMTLLALCGMALLTFYLDHKMEIVAERKVEVMEGETLEVLADKYHLNVKALQSANPGFEKKPPKEITLPAITDPRHPDVADDVFPHFIAHGLPVGISGLVVAALFAVAMSSLDSGINSVAAVFTVDVARRRNPDMTEPAALRLARTLTLIVGLACTAAAYLMYRLPSNYNIIGVTARTFNLALGPLGIMFIAGLFFRRVGQRAILVAVAGSLLIALVSAWYVELAWLLGFSPYDSFRETQAAIDGPSPFLITPFATVGGLLIALIASLFWPNRNTDKTEEYLWRSIVNRPEENQS